MDHGLETKRVMLGLLELKVEELQNQKDQEEANYEVRKVFQT